MTLTWADKARVSSERQSTGSQRSIDELERLWKCNTTPEEAAQSVADILEPIIFESPNDLRVAAFWGILCEAVRAEGSDLEFSRRILSLLQSLQKIKVTAGGHLIKSNGARFWEDLPGFALIFREYGICKTISFHDRY